jgi:diguanylate cyclase (GGDEF)-like protein
MENPRQTSTFPEAESGTLSECDRQQLAERNESSLDADVLPSPIGKDPQESTSGPSIRTPLLFLLGMVLVGIADWFTIRALGATMAVLELAGSQVALFAMAVALVIEHRRLIAERSVATTDFLTGIANRRGFYETLSREIERSRRYQTPMTLLYLDCDEFKTINDSFGHSAGNRLLTHIAAILRENTRASDVVGRLGGDEFAVVLVETPTERSAEVVARLQAATRSALGPEAPAVTFSIGAITFDSPPTNPNEAIRVADALMYEAKRGGKDRVVHATVGSAAQRLKGQRHVA